MNLVKHSTDWEVSLDYIEFPSYTFYSFYTQTVIFDTGTAGCYIKASDNWYIIEEIVLLKNYEQYDEYVIVEC